MPGGRNFSSARHFYIQVFRKSGGTATVKAVATTPKCF
jgi:hypothetical protein